MIQPYISPCIPVIHLLHIRRHDVGSEIGITVNRFTCGAARTLRDIPDQIMVKLSDRFGSQPLGNFDLLVERSDGSWVETVSPVIGLIITPGCVLVLNSFDFSLTSGLIFLHFSLTTCEK